MRKPKIMTIDIETSPHQSFHWRLFKENISISQLQVPTVMLSYAYKINEGKVVYRKWTDKDFHEHLYNAMVDVDAIITWNGDSFDLPHIDREFLLQGFTPRRPVASIDIMKTFKTQFRFASNKLDYAARELLGERKLDTGGFELWPAFMEGDKKALRTMERYNKKDTTLTWRIYKKLRPWVKNHPYLVADVVIPDEDKVYECEVCGHHNHNVPDYQRRTRCFAIRQIRCEDCGHWQDGARKKL